MVSMTYPDESKVTYSYDKNGNVLTVTDWKNRVTAYTYDKNGRLVTTKRPDRSTETRNYDKAGQLLTIKDVAKDGTIINDYSYTYDQSGNITAVTDQSVGNKNAETDADTATIQMEYDSVNRLVKYNGKEVRYDKDGNMTYGPLEGEMATFTYDCRNRLTEVTTDSGKTTQYQYDAENNRTAVIKNAGTTQETKTAYVVDSTSNELTRVLQATTVTKSGETERVLYTYGNGLIAQEKTEKLSNAETEVSNAVQTEVTDIVLAQNERKEYLLYHFNHIGSTTAVTDEAGAVKYTYTYSIYGELLSGNYGEVEFLYNGQYGVTSDDNGLYYMRARYYNIDIKRFINQDILTGSIDSSQSLNRYAYVEGNPVNFLDPFGLDEYRVDTTNLHLAAGVLGILGGELSKKGYITAGAVITAFANGFDIGLSLYDLYYNILDADIKESLKTIGGIVIDLVGIITAGIASSTIKEVQYVTAFEGKMTGYGELLIERYRMVNKFGAKVDLLGYMSMLEAIVPEIKEYIKEIFYDEQ